MTGGGEPTDHRKKKRSVKKGQEIWERKFDFFFFFCYSKVIMFNTSYDLFVDCMIYLLDCFFLLNLIKPPVDDEQETKLKTSQIYGAAPWQLTV